MTAAVRGLSVLPSPVATGRCVVCGFFVAPSPDTAVVVVACEDERSVRLAVLCGRCRGDWQTDADRDHDRLLRWRLRRFHDRTTRSEGDGDCEDGNTEAG